MPIYGIYAIMPYKKKIARETMGEQKARKPTRLKHRKMQRFYLRVKYTVDFVLALLALIVLSPLMLVIAICINAEDGGKVLIRQRRTGLGGKKFDCFKFRSMKSDCVPYDKHRRIIRDDDKNLTKVGRFIRKYKLDELPQLVNILKGDMCIVGPRPLLPDFDRDYEDWEMVKFEVRPGLTGLGQIYGNGYLHIYERKYYDAYYAMYFSLRMDIKIFFRTIGVIFCGEKRFLRRPTVQEYRKLRQEVKRCYTVQPETLAQLRPTVNR